jgi:hypothetical protein
VDLLLGGGLDFYSNLLEEELFCWLLLGALNPSSFFSLSNSNYSYNNSAECLSFVSKNLD